MCFIMHRCLFWYAQVHAPIFDPGTVLQLALFKETGPRTSRRTTMVGQLRIRLSSLSTDVLHSARLPLCASRQKGGERSATADLAIKARPHSVFLHFWSKLAGGDDLAYLGSPATDRCKEEAPESSPPSPPCRRWVDMQPSRANSVPANPAFSNASFLPSVLKRCSKMGNHTGLLQNLPCSRSLPEDSSAYRRAGRQLCRSECLQFSIAQVSYFSRLRLLRGYLSPPRPVGMYRHGLAGGDVRRTLERETARITMRWLESSSPPIPRSVADCLLRSPQCAPLLLPFLFSVHMSNDLARARVQQ